MAVVTSVIAIVAKMSGVKSGMLGLIFFLGFLFNIWFFCACPAG
eukprot:COSAG02_NODE_36881_length_449_cov_0.891429_1_plen_44_part_00